MLTTFMFEYSYKYIAREKFRFIFQTASLILLLFQILPLI